MQKIFKIFLNSIPVLVMVGLINLIENDYYLALVYVFVIFISFKIKRQKHELRILFLGFFIMTFFEYIFVMTGTEHFKRNSLFGIMPIWLPLLWAYGFVAIKRSIQILR